MTNDGTSPVLHYGQWGSTKCTHHCSQPSDEVLTTIMIGFTFLPSLFLLWLKRQPPKQRSRSMVKFHSSKLMLWAPPHCFDLLASHWAVTPNIIVLVMISRSWVRYNGTASRHVASFNWLEQAALCSPRQKQPTRVTRQLAGSTSGGKKP